MNRFDRSFLPTLFIAGFLLITFSTSYSQALRAELSSGFELGWWLHDRGVDSVTGQALGHDRTHLVVKTPIDFTLLLETKHVNLGLGVGWANITDDEMVRGVYATIHDRKYEVSIGYLKQLRAFSVFEWKMVNRPGITSGPHLKFGTFGLNDMHPDSAEFGFHMMIEGGWTSEIRVGTHSIIFRPMYSAGHIFLKDGNPMQKRHKLLFFGLHMGFRLFGSKGKAK